MKAYQVYFFFLKTVVLLQLILVFLNVDFAHNAIFLVVDTVFKISLGLFLGIYFWLFTPKGLDWEDGIIISIGGFLLLAEIKFKPLIDLYETRDKTVKTVLDTVR